MRTPIIERLFYLGGRSSTTYSEDNDLVRLAGFQGRNNAQRVGVVVDLHRARSGPPDPLAVGRGNALRETGGHCVKGQYVY